MPRLTSLNGCQSYLTGYSCWDNLIFCCTFNMKTHIPICDITPANTVPICTQKCRSIGCVYPNMCDSSCQWIHWRCKYLSFQWSMVHTRSLERVFCFVIRNFAVTAANSSCMLALSGRGEKKPRVLLSWKMGRHSPENNWVLICWTHCFGAVYSPTRKR